MVGLMFLSPFLAGQKWWWWIRGRNLPPIHLSCSARAKNFVSYTARQSYILLLLLILLHFHSFHNQKHPTNKQTNKQISGPFHYTAISNSRSLSSLSHHHHHQHPFIHPSAGWWSSLFDHHQICRTANRKCVCLFVCTAVCVLFVPQSVHHGPPPLPILLQQMCGVW